MLKSEVIDGLINEVKAVDCDVIRVYGVAMGIGYDLIITAHLKNNEAVTFKAHAGPRSWDSKGHLRARQASYNEYKGGKDPHYYLQGVKDYWEVRYRWALYKYLSRFNKSDLLGGGLQNVLCYE